MKHGTKVATCCYCGTKAALVLRGEKRHELTCSSCGAPPPEYEIHASVNAERQKDPKTFIRSAKNQKKARKIR